MLVTFFIENESTNLKQLVREHSVSLGLFQVKNSPVKTAVKTLCSYSKHNLNLQTR